MLAPDAEIEMFAPSLLAPVKIKSPRIEQFRPPVMLPNGTFVLVGGSRDPCRARDHDRQPVSQSGLSDQQQASIDLTRSTRAR